MGYSCRKENVLSVLSALEACLIRAGVNVNRGAGVQAALDYYEAPVLAKEDVHV